MYHGPQAPYLLWLMGVSACDQLSKSLEHHTPPNTHPQPVEVTHLWTAFHLHLPHSTSQLLLAHFPPHLMLFLSVFVSYTSKWLTWHGGSLLCFRKPSLVESVEKRPEDGTWGRGRRWSPRLSWDILRASTRVAGKLIKLTATCYNVHQLSSIVQKYGLSTSQEAQWTYPWGPESLLGSPAHDSRQGTILKKPWLGPQVKHWGMLQGRGSRLTARFYQ